MKRFLSTALVLLLGPLSCFAQGLVPARLVSVETNGFSNLAPQYATVQSALSWIDDNWDPLIDASGWTYLPTNAADAQDVFDWLDANLVVRLSTNAWTMLFPTNDSVQAAFDDADRLFGKLDESVSNLVQDVTANGEAIVDIQSNLQNFVRASELCDLVDQCLGNAPSAGDDVVYYGNAAYSPQEFVVDANMASLDFFAWGAGGNAPAATVYNSFGGAGAFVSGSMAVDTNAGAVLSINLIPTGAVVRAYVGIPNFGQNSEEAAGGRATRVDVVYAGTTNLLFIAGGGGGSSPYGVGAKRGGAGGDPNGYGGSTSVYTSADWGGPLTGRGGTGGVGSSAAGAGGTASIASWTQPLCTYEATYNGLAGAIWSSTSATRGNPGGPWSWTSFQISGTTCASEYETSLHYGGGQGGEGYYGGGGGGSAVATSTGYRNGVVIAGQGGGGSSWTSPKFAGATNESTATYLAYTNTAKYVSGYGGSRQPGVLVVTINAVE